jgi:hypothetical protein
MPCSKKREVAELLKQLSQVVLAIKSQLRECTIIIIGGDFKADGMDLLDSFASTHVARQLFDEPTFPRSGRQLNQILLIAADEVRVKKKAPRPYLSETWTTWHLV